MMYNKIIIFLCAIIFLQAANEDERIAGTRNVRFDFLAGGLITDAKTGLKQIKSSLDFNYNSLWIHEISIFGGYNQTMEHRRTISRIASVSARYGKSISRSLYFFQNAGIDSNYALYLKYRPYADTGLGYWVFDRPQHIKLLFELGGGWAHPVYSFGLTENSFLMKYRNLLEIHMFSRITLGYDFVLSGVPPAFVVSSAVLHAYLNTHISDTLKSRIIYELYYDTAIPTDQKYTWQINFALEWTIKISKTK